MRVRYLLLVLSFMLTGCSEAPTGPIPTCFPNRPVSKPLTSVQEKALAESKKRAADRCSRKDTQCGYAVVSLSGGRIGVGLTFAKPDIASGRCSEAIGDWYLDVYDQDANFLNVNPGL